MGRYRIGIDIGGTFTDFSLLDETTGELSGFKSPTVPGDPGRGVLEGLRALSDERGLDLGEIGYLVHGTTIAVNTVIQRNGATLGLLATAGFGDVLEIQRLRLASPVNFTATRPAPLIPRYRVGEVAERILADGTVDTALDREELLREATRLVEREGAQALVVAFINAYRTPAHEAEARKVLAERFPGLAITCSHEVWPQIREYERTMVAVLSAYVRPRVERYLEDLERGLAAVGVRVPLYITKSNGGVTTARDARRATAETMLSGPASGVIGATAVCVAAGYRNLITFDMGGTSADVALVRDGRPVYSTDEIVGDFPIVMPVVGVSSIGAGGGSVAWLDPVGRPQGRSAERRRGPRPRVLRPGRHRAGPVRRLRRVRLPEPRELRWRTAPAGPRASGGRPRARSPSASTSTSTRPRRPWSRWRPRTCTWRSPTSLRATGSTRATSPWWPSAAPGRWRRASSPRSSTSRASWCRPRRARSAPRAR